MIRILIVDDHPLYREGMVGALRGELEDVEVESAASAEEAFRRLESDGDVDLVLVDHRLPGMEGLEALAHLAKRFPGVARMLVSGIDDATLPARAMAAGASGFVSKAMTVDAVVHAVRIVLDGGTYVPPVIAAGSPTSAGALTLRQFEVLRLLAEGQSNKEIAECLAITERTAKAHVAAIFDALRVDNRTQAVVEAQRRGIVRAP